MQKKVWITSLAKDKNKITGLLTLVKKYGLVPNGHFWVDDIAGMAWQSPLDNLVDRKTVLWIISGAKKDFESESVRYGLSLLCLSMQNIKGIGFPIIFLNSDDSTDNDFLPTPLKGCEIISFHNKFLGAKITAMANTPVKKILMNYRINIHANQGYGIWFEFGPLEGRVWNGALAGSLKSEINAHGVGESGSLPLKSVLEYQMQGLKLKKGENEYTAWAVKNTIDENQSYYVRFSDIPGVVLFGEFPDDDNNEHDFHVLAL